MRLMDVNWKGVKGKPGLDYALLDVGPVVGNSRYMFDNPFGNDVPVICIAEVWAGAWAVSGWIHAQAGGGIGGIGVNASYIEGQGVCIQTGYTAVLVEGAQSGSGHPGGGTKWNVQCRVHIWRVHQ